LRNRGISVAVPVAADIIVSGTITEFKKVYDTKDIPYINIPFQIRDLIPKAGLFYMTVEPQFLNLDTADIERGNKITNFGYTPEDVAKKISERIADWVKSRCR
jgi:hypothetical protein